MSEIRLDKKAYINNLELITKKLGSKDKVMLVLKDNAYGHGSVLLGQIASEQGFKKAVVKCEREALEIQDLFNEILILSHIPNGCENQKFIYAINCINDLKIIKSGSKIHLAIDTLMHRNGLLLNELSEAVKIIKQRDLKLCGAYTHFRSADELNADYYVQKQNFKLAKKALSELGFSNLLFHSHASSAFERMNEFDDDCVRIGIAQFGYAQFAKDLALKPVLSLWAKKISQRLLKADCSVGYGAKFTAKNDIQIATYDLGYGDGLLRYNGVGELYMANKEKMLGKMSMDSFSCKDCGEWICVFDDARIWANFFNTIEYDILVKLSPFINRKFV
ncbi:MAG: alanine racemase [Campylobacter sp.]|nr:alanine racemase [Campylobacter sp.]